MKKLLFASACVATVAAFGAGAAYNWTGFESIPAGIGNVGLLNDSNQDSGQSSTGFYFRYQAKDSSTDGSTVKAYGVNDNLPIFDYKKLLPNEFAAEGLANNNYLELSTEGGTLWRAATDTGAVPFEEGGLGNGIAMGDLGSTDKVYVDTMVQFTPTEDGGTPTVENDDKLAIWLNVTTDENTGIATTNLCVLAGLSDSTPQVHKITNAGEVQPGVWYRLTVKAIADFTNNDQFPGFKIWLDGRLLESDQQALDEVQLTFLQDIMQKLSADEVALIRKGSVFGSLEGSQIEQPAFMGVGFKGSGAIDDLQIGEEEPNFFGAATSLDFTLVWGENISAVSYTINGGDPQTATSGTAITCDPDSVVTITATPANVWLAVDAASVADFKVTEAGKTHEITASEIASPIAGELTADVKDWATAKGGLTPDQITACTFAKDAYLMNTDLSAAPGLQITSITEVENGWQITVKGTQGTNAVTLEGINGALQVKAAATLEGLAEATPATYEFTVGENGEATITVTGDAKNFMKATVGAKTAPAAE